MEYFTACEMTTSGTYKPLEGEFTLSFIDQTSIQTHDKQPTDYTAGLLTVTTHRLIWVSPSRDHAVACWLAHIVDELHTKSKPFSQNARIHLRFVNNAAGVRLLLRNQRSSDADRVSTDIRAARARKEWERIDHEKERQRHAKKKEDEMIQRNMRGLNGVSNRIQINDNRANQVLHTGFQSLEQLREQAADLVAIANRLKHQLVHGEHTQQNDELLKLMSEMGIQSPVLKSSSGKNASLYIEQLSRELYNFLQSQLLKLGGIITLADAYCLVNRNRATTELISPSDFRQAVEYFSSLSLPSNNIELTTLESGIDALVYQINQANEHDVKAIGLDLKQLAEEKTSITAFDVIRLKNIPVQRARSLLEQVESIGLLARDDSIHGLRFFPNSFSTF